MALGDILRSFAAIGSPRGLAHDGRSLWYSESITDNIFQLDPRDATIQRSFISPGARAGDLAHDGRSLWTMNSVTALVHQLNPRDGTVQRSFATPEASPLAMTFHENTLWVMHSGTPTVFQLRPRDGVVLRTFVPDIATNGLGMASDGRGLWFSSSVFDELRLVSPRNGLLYRSVASPGATPRGLAVDGRTLWHCDSTTDIIYQLSLQ